MAPIVGVHHEDGIAIWPYHKRPHLRTTGDYGEWNPDDMANAAAAIDAWFVCLQSLTECPMFAHVRMDEIAQAIEKPGAGEANRTPDPNLGKVMLYP